MVLQTALLQIRETKVKICVYALKMQTRIRGLFCKVSLSKHKLTVPLASFVLLTRCGKLTIFGCKFAQLDFPSKFKIEVVGYCSIETTRCSHRVQSVMSFPLIPWLRNIYRVIFVPISRLSTSLQKTWKTSFLPPYRPEKRDRNQCFLPS